MIKAGQDPAMIPSPVQKDANLSAGANNINIMPISQKESWIRKNQLSSQRIINRKTGSRCF